MKILNNNVSEQFETFYKEITSVVGTPKFIPTTNLNRGCCDFKNGLFLIQLRKDLVKKNFEHHVAHELIHALQCKEGWPTISTRVLRDLLLTETGELLQSCVADLDVEDRLKRRGFDQTWILDLRYSNLRKEVINKDVKTLGTLECYNLAIMYAYASLSQPLPRRDKLSQLLSNKMPLIFEKGNEIVRILKTNGWSTPEQALNSTIGIRNSLGIGNDKLTIKDNLSGLKF
jgi:hypothetical protein